MPYTTRPAHPVLDALRQTIARQYFHALYKSTCVTVLRKSRQTTVNTILCMPHTNQTDVIPCQSTRRNINAYQLTADIVLHTLFNQSVTIAIHIVQISLRHRFIRIILINRWQQFMHIIPSALYHCNANYMPINSCTNTLHGKAVKRIHRISCRNNI